MDNSFVAFVAFMGYPGGMKETSVRLPSPSVAEVARIAARALSGMLHRRSSSPVRVRAGGGGSGTAVTVPREAFELFLEILGHMANGDTVTLIPIHAELTTQEAAELMGVSRPFLVRLLEERKIPCRLVGTHRRILASDVLEYRKRDEARRKAVLDELTREAEKHGLGY